MTSGAGASKPIDDIVEILGQDKQVDGDASISHFRAMLGNKFTLKTHAWVGRGQLDRSGRQPVTHDDHLIRVPISCVFFQGMHVHSSLVRASVNWSSPNLKYRAYDSSVSYDKNMWFSFIFCPRLVLNPIDQHKYPFRVHYRRPGDRLSLKLKVLPK
jgi:hypothetical protein